MRFVPLSVAFDSKAKLKLLKFLYNNYTPMSEREMAKVVGVSNASVSRIMRGFEAIDLVYSQRFGNVITWRINAESLAYKELSKIAGVAAPLSHLITTLRNGLANAPVKRAVLFGSVSQGRERPGSDIDLFILTSSKQDKAKLSHFIDSLSAKCLELYGNPLMPYVLTEKEFKRPPNPHLMEEIENGVQILPNSKEVVASE